LNASHGTNLNTKETEGRMIQRIMPDLMGLKKRDPLPAWFAKIRKNIFITVHPAAMPAATYGCEIIRSHPGG
jgi:hypothetical protein